MKPTGQEVDQRPTPVSAAPARRASPCTAAQHRFWVLEQMEPGNPALNIAVRWRLDGPITHASLERAWRTVVDRHDILRSFITRIDGALCQVCEPAIDFRVARIDLARHKHPAAELDRIAALEARTPFSLGMAPLLRVTCVQMNDHSCVLLVTAHHIVCDGWSVGILADEIGRLLGTQAAAALEDPPIQYGEYAAWQAQTADPERDAASLAYWRETLAGLRQFELIPDHPRPRLQTSNGQIASLMLDRALTDRAGAFGAREACSMYVVALTALLTLLGRHSQEADIALGTQLAGRDTVDLEQVVGVFINTVVLRVDLGGDPSVRALLARVATRVRHAIAHGAAPFDAVLETLRPPRDPSRNPLFSINFIFQRSFVANTRFGPLSLTDLPSVSAGALYDLNFFMVERPEGWRFSCEFNTDLFAPQTVDGLLRRFPVLLAAALDAPDQPISALDIMEPATRRWLIEACNATDSASPQPPTVPAMIAAQSALRPSAPAITCGGATLTYAALAQASGRLAAVLAASGIGPGDRVGILLDRSPDLVVALLAVLQSGAAYVPLDPAYPKARLQQIAADAGLAALLTTGAIHARHRLAADVVITLDALPPAPRSLAPPAAPAPGSAAYVIYTSGSTGLPKGVEVGHHALANLIVAMHQSPGIASTDVLLAVTTISFDIAALELFLPLAAGAHLVLATDLQKADGAALRQLLARHRVTFMQATPITWRLLLEAGWTGQPPLRMLCGGEALSRSLADALLACGGELWNMYGPTETTIWSAILRVLPGAGPVPIGAPIANTQLYVLDAHARLAPPGAPGELHIGGDGLAHGYFGKPALTAERFVPDPFRPGPNRRLYRTGDVVRRRADGAIDFLGRVDHQVKLRGFRIELGAIEAELVRHPGVTDAVVIAGAAPPSSASPAADSAELTELWAYAAIDPAPADPAAAAAAAARVRASLAQTLPSYMVPARIVVLPALPRLPNGKIDRAALPKPLGSPVALVPAAIPHADDIEAQLIEFWRRILHIDGLGPASDFFEIGGNSLTAARMLAQVNAAFGRELRPAILFRHPTLGELADLLRRPAEWDFDFSEVVQLQPEGSRPTLIALNNTGVFYRLARRLGPSQPFVALQLFDPALRRQHVPEDFVDIAAEYARLIVQAQPRGPYALIGWCIAGSLAFEVAHQLSRAGKQVCLVVIIDAWAPGFSARQTRAAAAMTDLSLRVQTILRDAWWVARGRQPLGEFIHRRRLLRRLLHRGGSAYGRQSDDERYHAWILDRLNAAARRYQPPDYGGHVLLLRARQEPAGPFIDRCLGWARHATGRLSTARISGDHSTIFTDPGLQQMADRIAQAMADSGA